MAEKWRNDHRQIRKFLKNLISDRISRTEQKETAFSLCGSPSAVIWYFVPFGNAFSFLVYNFVHENHVINEATRNAARNATVVFGSSSSLKFMFLSLFSFNYSAFGRLSADTDLISFENYSYLFVMRRMHRVHLMSQSHSRLACHQNQ